MYNLCMPLFTSAQRQKAIILSAITYANPFDPKRIAMERKALGKRFKGNHAIWSYQTDEDDLHNIDVLHQMVQGLVGVARDGLANGKEPDAGELGLYEDMVFYILYESVRQELERWLTNPELMTDIPAVRKVYNNLKKDYDHYFKSPQFKITLGTLPGVEHAFAVFFQVRRAFENIYTCMVGQSTPMAKLRQSVWQSLFTHDEKLYVRSLYKRMADFTTLITGPSGTGKELVARAIGQSRYIPFDPKTMQFVEHFNESFFPLNLSALSPTLIESELFGHKRGAFTGANSDRKGWLELCPNLGAVFLDEIGELDLTIQVKLLRVLQNRSFQRLGESKDRHFAGKIIAATNRDLAFEMQGNNFREDFYYRLCSDMIQTPSLAAQLKDTPGDLNRLVEFILHGLLGEKNPAVAGSVIDWIKNNLGDHYDWPGNIRELQQCVNNILIRGRYEKLPSQKTAEPKQHLKTATGNGKISAGQLLGDYCKLVYENVGSYEAAAMQLGLDRRTVKKWVDF